MGYANFEIIRPLYTMQKKVSSMSLKMGDRFIYPGFDSLLFKTNAKPESGKYLCCDERGKIEWISGETVVTKINGVAFDLHSYSCKFKKNI